MIGYVASTLMVSVAIWNGYDCILCSARASKFTSRKIKRVILLRIIFSAALMFGASAVV